MAVAISQAPGLSGTPELRPLLERGDQRILRQLLGQPDVAHHAVEAGDQPRRLDAPDGLDGAMGIRACMATDDTIAVGRRKPSCTKGCREATIASRAALSALPRHRGGFSQLIIHGIPKRSVHMPKRCAQKVCWNGM